MGKEVNAPDLGPALNMVRAAANEITHARCSALGVITLGELIRKLKQAKPEAEVVYDFCRLQPTELMSYRGFYDQLALGWRADVHDQPDMTAKFLLEHCEAAIGATYQGYKGGDYEMDANTAVWVDNWGEWTSTGITKVIIDDSQVILKTKRLET